MLHCNASDDANLRGQYKCVSVVAPNNIKWTFSINNKYKFTNRAKEAISSIGCLGYKNAVIRN